MEIATIIGNIHGNDYEVSRLPWRNSTWSLGDFVDLGFATSKTIDIMLRQHIKAIRGDHEQWIVDLLFTELTANEEKRTLTDEELTAFAPFLEDSWGGKATCTSYSVDVTGRTPTKILRDLLTSMPLTHKEYLLDLPLYHILDAGVTKVLLTHSGLGPDPDLKVFETNCDIEALKVVLNSKPPEYFHSQKPDLTKTESIQYLEGVDQIFAHQPTLDHIIRSYWLKLDGGIERLENGTVAYCSVILKSESPEYLYRY